MTLSTPARSAPTVVSSPYPWPYHGHFEPKRTALVACLDQRWRVERPDSGARDRRLTDLASALRALGGAIVAVTVTPSRREVRCSSSTAGGTIPPAVEALETDHRIAAGGTSAFFESPLDGLLRWLGRRELIIAGWGLEGPVHSTLRSANDRGYECLLVPDASVPLEEQLAGPACEMVRFSGGIFGAFAESTDVLATLAELSAASRPIERNPL